MTRLCVRSMFTTFRKCQHHKIVNIFFILRSCQRDEQILYQRSTHDQQIYEKLFDILLVLHQIEIVTSSV